jgi:branched-chain amino acid transport system substrate-binding protein
MHTPKKRWRRSSRLLLPMVGWLGIVLGGVAGCGEKAPIRIGFVAQLTGVQAELGIQERNGVQLAMEEINAAGGIGGHTVELVMRDDLGTPKGAQAADRELIDAGVVAIIGHATSSQTIAGLAVTNPARVVMLSPTATTPELSSRDDFFFRVADSLADRARALARHIYQRNHVSRLAVISDIDNAFYSNAFRNVLADQYRALGGTLVADIDFSSKAKPDLAPLVTRLCRNTPQGLLIIAADIDTALIAQRTRLMDCPIRLFTTAWAQTDTLINHGGRAVEGLELEITNAFTDQTSDFLDFKARYRSRFGQSPFFSAVLGYEAAQVLALALQKTGGRAEGLPAALVGIKDFKGLNDTFSIDRYGDAIRPFYMGVIREGKFVPIETLMKPVPQG